MNVLIIEDFKNTGQIIKGILETNQYTVDLIISKHTHQHLEKNVYNLIILDLHINYLKINSVQLLKEIKLKYPNIFVIGISSKATWNEKVEFLNTGADDVIDYPFPIQELIARIESLNRRPRKAEPKRIRMRERELEIDTELKMVTVKDKELNLRKKEYSLLEYLVKNKNRVISRIELLDHVWDYRKINSSNTVDVHVKRLRDKMKDRNFIKTVHGFGYTLSPKVEKRIKAS